MMSSVPTDVGKIEQTYVAVAIFNVFQSEQ